MTRALNRTERVMVAAAVTWCTLPRRDADVLSLLMTNMQATAPDVITDIDSPAAPLAWGILDYLKADTRIEKEAAKRMIQWKIARFFLDRLDRDTNNQTQTGGP